MRFSDLYSRLLLTLIAGCLLYIAGALRTLVQQADTYAAHAATRPAAMPVGWSPAPAPATPMRVYIAGFSHIRSTNKWDDYAFDYRQDAVLPVRIK